MLLSLKLPSYLSKHVDTFRSVKCRAWYILHCVKYVYEHKIDIYSYYEGVKNDETRGNDIREKD